MRVETQLKRRERAVQQLRDQFRHAAHFGLTSTVMNISYAEICGTTLRGTPQAIRAYVDGYRRALTDKAYESELVFGGFIGDVFYSVHRDRADYYEKHGIEPNAYLDDGLVTRRGYYWRQSVDAGAPRAFFALETK